ncbi:hypothetical protein AcW1_010068 [Taiwanofungus camphoratus]|nr:hypothetical protein AcW1_010068 [Antrodia cinnamomea]
MPPIARTEREEADFMNDLLFGLDNSFPSTVPSSKLLPKKISRATLHQTPKRRCVKHGPTTPKTTLRTPAGIFVAQDVDIDQLVEGAEDWDWDDMNSECMTSKENASPTQALAIASSPEYHPAPCTRCIVKAVHEVHPESSFQKTLTVETIPSKERRCVVLRDDWTDADVQVGDVINVIGTFTSSSSVPSSPKTVSSITITAKSNLFIHHPDLLITATSLSSAPQCRRKPLISNLVRGSVDATPALVWGNILHEVMQACLGAGRWDDRWVDEKITEVVNQGLGELMRVNMGVEQAKKEVRARAKGVKRFAEKYIAQEPKPDALMTNTRAAQGQTSLLAISRLHDIEEDIWSPTYGLKGKLDASVQVVVSDIDHSSSPFAKAAPRKATQNLTMPLEIKTGRAVAGMEHRAQTMLYTLLMAERYSVEVPSGLLYYTQSDEVVRVPAAKNEVRALLVARNEMAGYMMRRMRVPGAVAHSHIRKEGNAGLDDEREGDSFLPPTIDDAWQCGKCYALDTCMLYRKAVENIVDTTSPIADIYSLKTSHLSPTQTAFFKNWEALISLEEQDLIRFQKELWTMGAKEREDHGRCFSNMILDVSYRAPASTPKPTLHKEGKIHRFTYRFVKSSLVHTSLLNGHMSSGDAITVSVEPGLLALARGFIVNLTPQEVVVGVDHELNLEAIGRRLKSPWSEHAKQPIFRIDKDELFGGMGRMRDNLAQLFYVDGDNRRLELVVDLKAPRFEPDNNVTATNANLPTAAHLNEDQRAAVKKVMSAQDYALILGMPGTGKTTVIAALIKELASKGKTVLLASYTHSAVDTILLKLQDVADFGILRLGNLDKIHPDVQKFTLSAQRRATTIEQLEHQVMTPPVVATTCLSIDHPLFSLRKFDYCIVDEASQITLPTCLGPLRFADKFVLVGDHFQLPPLVRNRAARKGGLDISLFRRLSDAHPISVVDLTQQYRMNADIMLLSNKLIYNDRLRCGSEAVAKRSLQLPDPSQLHKLHSSAGSPCRRDACWLAKLMDESCKAVFVDTDAVPAYDSRIGDLVENQVEARLVQQVAECLLRSGVRPNQIGVLSLYRQQIKLLSYLLQDREGIEVLTADRSQGRDKDCIIISMVRSNDHGQACVLSLVRRPYIDCLWLGSGG